MNRDVVFDKLRTLLADIFEVDASAVHNDINLSDDLEADSLDLVELIETLRDDFDISIANSEIKQLIVDMSEFMPAGGAASEDMSDEDVEALTRQVTVGTLVDFIAARA
jgi:acyl carrier protein